MSNGTDSIGGGLLGGLKGSLSLVQNFYIEFFGTLIPGVIAVVCISMLGLGISHLACVDASVIKEFLRIAFCTVGGVVTFLVISYVVGAIAYRRSPKTPDTIASYSQWRLTRSGSASDEVGRMSVTFDESKAIPSSLIERIRFLIDREHWILRKAGSSIDFPYPLMRKYLCCRGLNHLADYVPWCAGSGGSAFKENFQKGVCSKVYVNIIKQRVRNSGNENLIMDMIRNECHIRMLCSLWYIFTFVFRVLLLSFVAVFCWKTAECATSLMNRKPATVKSCEASLKTDAVETMTVNSHIRNTAENGWGFEQKTEVVQTHVPSESPESAAAMFLALTFAGIVLVFHCRRNIERGLHYVRTREVTMILESAWIMDNVDFARRPCIKLQNGRALFQDIKDQAMAFRESHCSNCKCCRQCHGDETMG